MWNGLRGNRLGAKFRRQESIGVYVVDFYCPELRLAIEVDGVHHEHSREYDSARDEKLKEVHVRTLRFPDSEVISNSDLVLSQIEKVITEMRQHGMSVRTPSTQMSKSEKAILEVRDGGQPPPGPRLKKTGVNVQIFLIGLIVLFGSAAFAQSSGSPAIPMLHAGYVLDETNTLNPSELAALDAKLRHYEDSTSTQICIVLIPSLKGNPVEDFAVTVLDSNHIGQAHKNNGALILLALTDHQGWISTGYGLEPTLTDAASSMIYQQILVPALRKGDVYGGLDQATTAMFQVIGGEFKNENPQSPFRGRRGAPSPGGALIIVFGFFIFLFIMRALAGTGSKRTVVGAGGAGSGCMGGILQGLFWSSIFNSGRGGWGGGGFGGGGFGGGGFGGGGFSGGGGMGGGGGAGGGW